MTGNVPDVIFALIAFITIGVSAQTPPSNRSSASIPDPQLQLVGREAYEVNGVRQVRFKLSVTNRASHPDFLWHPSSQLPSCGKNEKASRTWVEVFGSPGDKRFIGFCGLRSSDDLGQLWFPAQSKETRTPCVYIVMTDRETGKKYVSNRVCSRSFTASSNSLKGTNSQPGGELDVESWQWHPQNPAPIPETRIP